MTTLGDQARLVGLLEDPDSGYFHGDLQPALDCARALGALIAPPEWAAGRQAYLRQSHRGLLVLGIAIQPGDKPPAKYLLKHKKHWELGTGTPCDQRPIEDRIKVVDECVRVLVADGVDVGTYIRCFSGWVVTVHGLGQKTGLG